MPIDGIELRAVTKRYRSVTALDSMSLLVPAGQVFGFLGPNGAGKTTAMRCVFGIAEPDEGTICWNGHPVTRADRTRFGYMPEERGLYPRMEVGEQLVYLARLHGLTPQAAHASRKHWLEVFELAERTSVTIEELSLGNQQRVQLASALVHSPEVLVLDEPFSGLDPPGVDLVGGVLSGLAAQGATVLFSSHQLDLVQHVCAAVAIVARGRLVATGTVEDLTRTSDRVFEIESAGPLPALPGVEAQPGPDGRTRLELADGVDPQKVLEKLVAAGHLTYFSVAQRRLSEVFREVIAP